MFMNVKAIVVVAAGSGLIAEADMAHWLLGGLYT
jgi:hypothetical protein